MTINNMENALALYEQAATYFTDREWKARALFMASSCTMDLYAKTGGITGTTSSTLILSGRMKKRRWTAISTNWQNPIPTRSSSSKLCTNANILTTT